MPARSPSSTTLHAKKPGRDPRLYQIAVLGSLLLFGVFALDFDIDPRIAPIILAGALATQWIWTRLLGLERFDPRSPLISGLSLCLLLRTPFLDLALLAVFVTISSKFLLRARGKHIFNPTNFGLALILLLDGGAWVSSGQWGSAAWLGLLLASVGILVVHRAERSDVTWGFLAAYAGLLFGRALWLGDPLAIPLHQLKSGALLIFAFFMISDPKTTPDSRAGRLLFASLVAGLALYIQFGLYRPNGLIWALLLMSPAVPVIDCLLPGRRYAWPAFRPASASSPASAPALQEPAHAS